MIQSKHINKIVVAVMVVVLLLTGGILYLANDGTIGSYQPEYVTKLFGSGTISIEIEADEEAWTEMLANATAEEYIACNVTVNGTRYTNVGIRPKGNSSLTQVSSSDSHRYSFRLKFDEYIKGQTCYGLSSFVVNNMLGDATYMKEYVSYDIMKYIGVDTTLYEYADISLNGQSWGVYLAVESYDEEFMERTYGILGQLYSVKTSMGRGMKNKVEESTSDTTDRTSRMGGGMMGEGMMGGMGNDSGGGSLAYTDDDPDSYSSIFENAVTKTNESDEKRLVKALKALSEGKDLEQHFDVDQIIRYFAAQTVSVNLDSYLSNMAQNYFLYEKDGKVTILPWDYNLAWGGFQSGSASDVVNFPIDTPVSGVSVSDRPLLAMVLENEEYLEKYHQYLQDIINGYFNSGKFVELIKMLDEQIGECIKTDSTAFYTYEEYKEALTSFENLGLLRSESIQAQLDGTLPSTTEEQSANSATLVAADSVDMNALGSMMGGNRENGGMDNAPTNGGGRMFDVDQEIMEQAMSIIQGADGEITDEIKEQLLKLGLTEDQITMFSNMGTRGGGRQGQRTDNQNNNMQNPPDMNGQNPPDMNGQNAPNMENMPDIGNAPWGQQDEDTTASGTLWGTTPIILGGVIIVLAAALVFAVTWRKKG